MKSIENELRSGSAAIVMFATLASFSAIATALAPFVIGA